MTTAPAKPKVDGFIVGQDIATHKDNILPDGSLDIEYINISLSIRYPKGMDLKQYKAAIERAIVATMPAAYMELERRAQ